MNHPNPYIDAFLIDGAPLDGNTITYSFWNDVVPWGIFNAQGVGWDPTGLQQGGFGFITLIHELGHGLGLASSP